MLASMFVVGGINSIQHAPALAARAKPVADRIRLFAERRLPITPPNEVMLVRLNGAAHVLAGLSLATGRMPRTSSLLLASTLVPTTLGGHRFWEESDPQLRQNQQIHFFKNVSMLGGLIIAAGDTEGRPGLAWRAKHAMADAAHAVADARDNVTAHLPVG